MTRLTLPKSDFTDPQILFLAIQYYGAIATTDVPEIFRIMSEAFKGKISSLEKVNPISFKLLNTPSDNSFSPLSKKLSIVAVLVSGI